MYTNPLAGPGVAAGAGLLGTGGLAATGLAFDGVWLFLAAFALLSALLAIKRILPARR